MNVTNKQRTKDPNFLNKRSEPQITEKNLFKTKHMDYDSIVSYPAMHSY